MSSTWHWNHRNYYTTCSSLWTTKSSPCCWKILLRLQELYPHPLCWLAYHCANPSCGNVCHLGATCSGFVNPRGNVRARALFTRVWHCHLHSLTSVTSDPSLSPDNSPPRPTVPSLKSPWIKACLQLIQKIWKKSVLSALLFYVLTPSQWGTVYVPRDSIRNAALDQKLQLVTTTANVKSAPTFNKTVRLNLQIVSSLNLLTHFIPNLYLILSEISWKSINGMLTVFVQN